MSSAGVEFNRLVEIMAKLRAPDGCPWDREQTFDSIKPYTVEETYEVLDAIDQRDWEGLKEELGDFMLQAVFFAQMASEEKLFSIRDSLVAINEKLIRRHPHIFGDAEAKTSADVLKRWNEIKLQEKAKPAAMLDRVPRAAPALIEAQQIAAKAAGVGFDWENAGQVFEKLDEEIAELKQTSTPDQREDEIGDLFFVVVNLARFYKVDPEQSLRRANAKFRRRFGHIEKRLAEMGKTFEQSNIQEMESLWQEAKTDR